MAHNERPEKLAWSVNKELVAATGLSTGMWRKIITANEIPITRAGRRVLILDSDLRAYLAKKRSGARKAS